MNKGSRRRPRAPRLELPPLKPAGDNPSRLACSKTGPGRIPPRDARPTRLELTSVRVSSQRGGIEVKVRSAGGKTPAVGLELRHRGRKVTDHALGLVGPHGKDAQLRVRHRLPPPGSYEVVLTADGREVTTRRVKVRRRA